MEFDVALLKSKSDKASSDEAEKRVSLGGVGG